MAGLQGHHSAVPAAACSNNRTSAWFVERGLKGLQRLRGGGDVALPGHHCDLARQSAGQVATPASFAAMRKIEFLTT